MPCHQTIAAKKSNTHAYKASNVLLDGKVLVRCIKGKGVRTLSVHDTSILVGCRKVVTLPALFNRVGAAKDNIDRS
jgi:hypothetical protein